MAKTNCCEPTLCCTHGPSNLLASACLQQHPCLAGGIKPSYSQLLELQSQGRASPIKSPLLSELEGVLSVADQWLLRCTAAVARRSAQTLKSCLEAMAASVQRAQEQMEAQLRKLQVHAALHLLDATCRKPNT